MPKDTFKTDTEVAVKKAKKVKNVITVERDEVDVRDVLKNDDNFKKYRRIVKVVTESMDLEKIEEEMERLHASRSSRRLYGTVPTPEQMVRASLQDGSARSRLSEIRVEMTKQCSLVDRATSTIKKYILNEFRDQTVGLRTKGERMAYADQYVSRGVVLISKLEDIIERCDFLIKDVDQMNYSMKLGMTALEIFYSHKNDKKGI